MHICLDIIFEGAYLSSEKWVLSNARNIVKIKCFAILGAFNILFVVAFY